MRDDIEILREAALPYTGGDTVAALKAAHDLVRVLGPTARKAAFDLLRRHRGDVEAFKPAVTRKYFEVAGVRIARKNRDGTWSYSTAPRADAALEISDILYAGRERNPRSIGDMYRKALRKRVRSADLKFLTDREAIDRAADAALYTITDIAGEEGARDLLEDMNESPGWWLVAEVTPSAKEVFRRMRKGTYEISLGDTNFYFGTKRQAATEAMDDEGFDEDFKISRVEEVVYQGIPVLVVEARGPWESFDEKYAHAFNRALEYAGGDADKAAALAASNVIRNATMAEQAQLADLLDAHGGTHLADAVRRDLQRGVSAEPTVHRAVLTGYRASNPNTDVKIPAIDEGALGGPGFLAKPAKERRKLLARSVKRDGYRTTLGRLNALAVFGKNRFSKKQKNEISADRKWLVKQYGGPGSFSPRS